MLAVGIDVNNNPYTAYCGQDYSAAKSALDDAGNQGTITIGYIFKNPPANETLRYGPGV
jgi:hypothetical protein